MDEKVFAKISKTRVTGKGHARMRHTVNLELHSLCGQAPHFSATLDTYRWAFNRWAEDSFGAQHDEIARLFPELQPYLRWHLVSTEGPMHYIANAAYWAGLDKQWCQGKLGDPPNRQHFDFTVLWGTLPGDDGLQHPMDDPDLDRAKLTAILEARRAALLAAYQEAMETLFGTQATEMLGGVQEAFAVPVERT